jgi:hypothetical protein
MMLEVICIRWVPNPSTEPLLWQRRQLLRVFVIVLKLQHIQA